ncbi:MAG: DUF1343 domain-containing protein [Bacteroidota bacterium]
MKTAVGLEVIAGRPALTKSWGRCGVLLNQASVDAHVVPSQVVLKRVLKNRLAVLFSPQHGLFADKQDNMVESGHGRDFLSGLPFYSLYSDVREPTDSMLEGLDTVIVDIQDVGTRVYTFIYTMAGILRRCAALGKKVIVLDRPNPIGGTMVEGNILEDESKSFVGEYPLPMRHGMTIGELALWMNETEALRADLEVIRMRGWKRAAHWQETGRKWIMTSPNMPTAETAEVYPGMVLLEGTNISEGRGTTMPFLTIGAPYIERHQEWLDLIRSICDCSGLVLRPTVFEPTFHKWAGKACRGVQFVPLEPARIKPYQLGLGVLLATMHLAPQAFQYKDPPYEYETVRPPIQLLIGSRNIAGRLLALAKQNLRSNVLSELEEEWRPHFKRFFRQRKDVLLYS